MSDFLDRGARALADADLADYEEGKRLTQTALLAALDPEDEALRFAVAAAIREFTPHPDMADDMARAVAAIASIKTYAQGE